MIYLKSEEEKESKLQKKGDEIIWYESKCLEESGCDGLHHGSTKTK